MRRLILISLGGLALGLALAAVGAVPTRAEAPTSRLMLTVPTQLQIYPVEDVPLGKSITVTALLTDVAGNPLPNETVAFLIDSNYQCQGRTDASGRTSGVISAGLPAGKHTVKAIFLGMKSYQPSNHLLAVGVLPAEVAVRTVPPLAGIHFLLGGKDFYSGPDGLARVSVDTMGEYSLTVLPFEDPQANYRVDFNRWLDESFIPTRLVQVPGDAEYDVGLKVSYRVGLTFLDLQNNPVDPSRIVSITLKNSQGTSYTFQDGSLRWLPASLVTRRVAQLEVVPIQYSVMSVVVEGSNVVNSQQQRFYPQPDQVWPVRLLLYSVRLQAQDALLHTPVGTSIAVDFPDNTHHVYSFGGDSTIGLSGLARGIYHAQVQGVSGLTPSTPLALSRDQVVTLTVVTQFDIFLAVSLVSLAALGMVLLGRGGLLVRIARSRPVPSRQAVVDARR